MEETLKIATRGSRLALKQFELVARQLEAGGLKVQPVIIKPLGERDTETPLYDMKEQGVFVRNLNDQILEGNVAAAVHSAKDIPNEIDQKLEISYFSRRADPRDFFISASPLEKFSGSVGSSSMRRKNFIHIFNSNTRFESIRGNIETRIGKWERGMVDSIVVAKAALDRLDLHPKGEVISESICPPDPNQGFIAVVTEKGSRLGDTMRRIQESEPLWEASKERNLMVRLRLGCNLAVSIRAEHPKKTIRFSYANEAERYDFTFKEKVDEPDIRKLEDIIGS
jgi:hydroxymethylbilane synthase